VCISDTHGLTDQENFPPVPDGDILLHAGDISQQGNVDHIAQFNAWLGSLPHQYKIVIAGNHDKMLDPNLNETSREMKRLLTNCIYLEDDAVYIKGIKIYGTPFSKKRMQSTNHAFQMSSEELKSRSHWGKNPYFIQKFRTLKSKCSQNSHFLKSQFSQNSHFLKSNFHKIYIF